MNFDVSKLKKRPSHPFETIAVAIAFSSRLERVLAEAKRIRDAFHSQLILIHIGPKTKTKEQQLDKAMKAADVNENECRIIWMEGDPVDTILKLCKLNIVDLLILGALQRENILKFYLGSLARTISRKAKCSVLLLTHPKLEHTKLKKIVVNGVDNPKTLHTVNTAVYFAKHFGVKNLTVIRELENPVFAMSMADSSTAPEATRMKKEITEAEESQMHDIIKKCRNESVEIEERSVKGKPGYAISKYARDKKADLLVINSPDTNLTLLDRIFTHDIEYILADLPCDVLIVHSRI